MAAQAAATMQWALLATHGVLLAVLAAAVATDLAWRRIPDWLTVPAMVAALALSFGLGDLSAGWTEPGPKWALAGLLAGLGPFLLAARAGWMGRGDAMLMGVVGAATGFPGALGALLLVSVAGGVQGLLAVAARTGAGRRLCARLGMKRTDEPDFARTVPYGLAIAAGGWAFVLWLHLG